MNKSFPAKLILFGEYAIVLGFGALAIPFRQYAGELRKGAGDEIIDSDSNNALLAFYEYLDNAGFGNQLHLKQFKADIEDGMFFKSDIPAGYGLGSSGALCAAVYAHYKTTGKDEPAGKLKHVFSTMESHFHGKSSGTDPLVIYLNHPVLISGDDIRKVDLAGAGMNNGLTIFLINTNSTASTGVLVEEFLKDMKRDAYSRRIHQEYLPLTAKAIRAFVEKDKHFYRLVERLSTFQLEYFKKMIPDIYLELWRHGLLNRKFALKLCGSGGGGFLLGFSQEPPADIKSLFNRTFQEDVLFIHKFE